MLLCGAVLHLSAQQKTLTGAVKDEKGNPFQSVSVQVKGSSTGTTTRADGTFSLVVPSSATTLVFSFVGYKDVEAAIGSDLRFDISLSPGGTELREVVVTALGIARDKRALGYATQNIKSDQLVNKGDPNLLNVLQGKVAGVNITSASGSPGASTNINIRGITSFTGSNQPLFVVDGIPVSNDVDRTNGGPLGGGTLADAQPSNRILDLNLNNIESVNILKGPAAAVLYGSRASAGAIIITTKKGAGSKGKMEVSFNSTYAFQQVSGLPELQNEYGQGFNGQFNAINSNSWGPRFGTTPSLANGLINPATGQPFPYQLYENNIRDFFETGTFHDNTLTINAGDASQNMSLSLGHFGQKGIMPNTHLNRTSIHLGGNMSMKKMKIGGSITYTSTLQDGVLGGNSAGGGSGWAYLVSVPRSLDLKFYKDNYKNPDGTQNWPLPLGSFENPYFTAYENPFNSTLSRFMGNLTLGYDIFPWLNVMYRLGADVYTDRRKQVYAVNSRVIPKGNITEDIFFRNELNGDFIITARKSDLFTKGFNGSLLLGQNINQRRLQNVTAKGDDITTIPGFYNLSNALVFTNGTAEGSTLQRLIGYYAQISADWKNYLFLELTGRVDQSSTLAPGNNTYFYPSATTSFVFTDALKINSKVLNYGKLRASIAKVGRDAAPYLLDNVYVPGAYGNNVASITFPVTIPGSGTINGFSLSSRIANRDIEPEFTTSYEVGLNLGFFKNRITLDVAYFNQVSRNQIINVAVPTSSGFGTRTANVGEMKNKGVEVLLNAIPVNGKDFRWDISANFTRIRNKVTEIFGDVQNFPISSGQSFTGVIASVALNQPYGVIIGSKFPRSPDGQFIINPATGLFQPGVPNQVLADPNPDFTAGLTNNFRYKNFTLSALTDLTYGGEIFSFTVAFLRARGMLKETAVGRELPMIIPGVIQTGPDKFEPNTIQVTPQAYWQAAGLSSDLSAFDATVFRLRELSLSYDIPGKVLDKGPFSNIRFSLFGRNLFFYAPNFPMDPEVNTQGAGNLRGLDLQGAPNTRTMGMSLRVAFK